MKPTNKISPPPQGGIKPQDILYALFKHKWKIILLSLAGFAAAGGMAYWSSLSPSYETQAKLLVRYVVERSETGADAPASRPGDRGSTVMDSELQIISSFDVAVDAATAVGPEKLLPDHPGQATATEAAAHLMSGFQAVNPRNSNVIHLSYRDSDPQVAVEALRQLIESYFAKHLQVHRSTGAFDQVNAQADQARSALRLTENEINRLKSESGVLSIEATIAEFESRRQIVRGTLMAAEAALAEQRAKVAALSKSAPAEPETTGEVSPEAQAADPAMATEQDRSRRELAEALAEYQDINVRLGLLRQERNQLLLRRTDNHPAIPKLDQQISALQRQSFDLRERYPELAGRAEFAGQAMPPVTSLEDERALQAAIEAKVQTIKVQAEAIESEVEGLSALGFKLEDLERRREMEDQKYRYYQSSVERARVDEALDPAKMENIKIIQSPSTPAKSFDKKTMQIILGLAGSGLAAGLVLAFLIEFVIDRRVSRPGDIQARLQLPLMMSIPHVRSKDGVGKLVDRDQAVGMLMDTGDPLSPPPLPEKPARVNGRAKPARNGQEHFITPFARAIHDRIIFNFELNNITHKPKLVALTGLSSGAGTSTIAAGIARAFSDQGNRKVLLVDLNPPVDNLQYRGHPADSLRRALEFSKGEEFRQSRKNLYYASAQTRRNGNSGDFALAPAALQEIMPHLVASDYDYIVFDMPPVEPTSPTFAMAGFMDKVLLVLDAGATTPDKLRWAYTELERGRADVSCVFNKTKSHAPRWVEGGV